MSKRSAAAGFTIVELMMATLVFSIILLVVTIGVLQVNRVYYKGVTEANTQNVARSIMDTISQAIQFNGGSTTPLPTTNPPSAGLLYYVCVNNQEFVYWPGFQLVNSAPGLHQTTQTLIQRTIAGSCAVPVPPITGGRELLSPGMRLSNLQVSNIPGTRLYKIEVKVTYGDDAVLNNPTSINPTCKGAQTGNHFCSVSDLSTVVEKRIN